MKVRLNIQNKFQAVSGVSSSEEIEFTFRVQQLINLLEKSGYPKTASEFARYHRGDLAQERDIHKELSDYFEDMNYHNHSYAIKAMKNKVEKWQMDALASILKIHDKLGHMPNELINLRDLLSKSENQRVKSIGYPVKVSPEGLKLIKKLPKKFQDELQSKHNFDF